MAMPWEIPPGTVPPEIDPGLGGTAFAPTAAETLPWPPDHWNQPPEAVPPPPWMVSEPPPPAPAPAVAPPPAPGGGPVPPEPDVVSAAAPVLPRGAPVPAAMQPPTGVAPARPREQKPQDALGMEEKARVEQAKVGQGYTQRAADVLAKHSADELRIQTEEASKAKAWESDLRGQMDEMKGAHIDRRRLFKDAGIGGSLAMLGGAILNGFVAPLQGGRNQALEIVQHMVDQDIATQESDIANRRSVLGAEQGLYTQYLAGSGDRQKARALVTAGALDALDKQMAAEQALYDSDLIKADIQKKRDTIAAAREELIAKNGQQQFENQLALRKQAEQERSALAGEKLQKSQIGLGYANLKEGARQFNTKAAMDQDQFNRRLALDTQELLQKGETAKAEALQKQGQTVIFGVQGAKGERITAPSKEEAEKINQGIGSAEEAYQALERLVEMRKEYGHEFEDPLFGIETEAGKQMKSLHATILTKLKESEKLGAISGSDLELMQNQIGEDPRGWKDNSSRWEEARKNLKLGVQSQVKNRTGNVVNWDPTLRPQGFQPGGKVTQKTPQQLEAEGAGRQGAQQQRLEEDVYGPRSQPAAPQAPPRSSMERLYYGGE